MTDKDLIKQRLNKDEGLTDFREKVYEFRRLVAGDVSSLFPAPSAEGDGVERGKKLWNLEELNDFIVTFVADGRSNKLLQQLKTLLMQTAYYFPEIHLENLSPDLAAVNAEYCKIRMGEAPLGCNAKDHMRMALLDYMIGGIGWTKACVIDGKPAVQYCDNIDMTWDRSSRLPTDIKWASCKFRERLGAWVEMLGAAAFADDLKNPTTTKDDIVELEWYYDVNGAEGTWAVYKTGGRGQRDVGKPIFIKPNPYYYEVGREKTRVPYIPYEPLYFIALPSLRVPIGLVEMMLPSQIALWEVENNIRATIQRGAPFYTVLKNTLDPKDKQKFEDGDIGTIIDVNSNDPNAIRAQSGIQLQPEILRWQQYHDGELVAHSGANPYAAGNRVEGVEFASEVHAIQGQSGLTVGTIGKDLAAYWERVTRKFLAGARLYEDASLTIRLDDAELEFDPSDPIKKYLIPDADIVVNEGTMAYRPRTEKIQEALVDLQLFQGLAAIYPEGLERSLINYLQATGRRNYQAWLAKPEPQPVMSPPGFEYEERVPRSGEGGAKPPTQNPGEPNPEESMQNPEAMMNMLAAMGGQMPAA